MAENAILEQLRSQAGGLAFLSRAWLARPIKLWEERRVAPPTGYPRDLRTFDSHLRSLEKLEEIARIRAADGGAWYGLRTTFNAIIPTALDSLRRSGLPGRGTPATMSILIPGPAALPEGVRERIWTSSPELPSRSALRMYVMSPIIGLHGSETGEPLETARISQPEDQQWVLLSLTTERRTGHKIRYHAFDESGVRLHRGVLSARNSQDAV